MMGKLASTVAIIAALAAGAAPSIDHATAIGPSVAGKSGMEDARSPADAP
jgi:hypothetical protein